MYTHHVKADKEEKTLEKEKQLAWKIAGLAVDAYKEQDAGHDIYDAGVVDMIKNRIIDNAAIAMAAINEKAVAVARAKALATEGTGGATLFGVPRGRKFGPREAAFANAVAVRFRDQDDTYLANEYTHPDDNISPLLAVAQQMGIAGKDLTRGIAVAYEVHIALAGTGNNTGIDLHSHNVDHMTHIAAASAAGLASMLRLDQDQTYHAINFAVHNAISSRQSRRGDIGAQKEFVPGFSAEIAIDAVNAAMQDLKGPNPVYEGNNSIIASFLKGRDHSIVSRLLDSFEKSPFIALPGAPTVSASIRRFLGPEPEYTIELAEPGKDKLKNIMRSYPKQHAFEYQGQAIIDLALEMRAKLPKKSDGSPDLSQIDNIFLETSNHTHAVIGSGSKTADFDPAAYAKRTDIHATRGTLDHSIMFAIARTLQLGKWDEDTYKFDPKGTEGEELGKLMRKIKTRETKEWEKRYHSTDPNVQAFGGNMIINLAGGQKLEEAKAVANAHPLGKTPWKRPDYEKKFDKLTEGIVNENERNRFFANVDRLETLSPQDLEGLTTEKDREKKSLRLAEPEKKGIYGAYESPKYSMAV